MKTYFRPKFCIARPVAYAEKDEIAELDRLVKVGYYVPVDTSQWHRRSYQLGKAIIPVTWGLQAYVKPLFGHDGISLANS